MVLVWPEQNELKVEEVKKAVVSNGQNMHGLLALIRTLIFLSKLGAKARF